MLKSIRIILLLGHILLISTYGFGQDMSFNQNISKPTKSIIDSLSNGLKYYIKENDKPQDKVEIRLIFRLGSLQEDKGEEGVAHFLEHMMFEGSKNYPDNTAVLFWESLGAKFGTSINAYTGYDRTVYIISIPSDKQGNNLKKTLQILRDWLTSLSLKDTNIQKQKKIIYEEIAGYIKPDIIDEFKKGNCPQLKRLPVGTKEEITKINREKILHFYEKWYKPQNAGIAVVGDISLTKTQKEIKELFSDLERGDFESENDAEIFYGDVSPFIANEDTSKSKAEFSLLVPFRYMPTLLLEDLVEDSKVDFVLKLLNRRLQNTALKVSKYWYLQKTGFLEFSLEDSKDIKGALRKGMSVVEGMKKTGVTEEEIFLLLPEFLDDISSTIFERSSESWADSFVEMFIFKERQLAIDKDKEFIVNELKRLTTEQWNTEIIKVLTFQRPKLGIYNFNPQKHQKVNYKEIQQILTEANEAPDTTIPLINACDEEKIKLPNSLVKDFEFNAKMIKKEIYYPSIGIYFVELINGAKLYLKPTIEDERLNLNISFKGGLSLLPEDRFKQMEDVISYIGLGGTQKIHYEEFSNILAQEDIAFVNTNENYFHGVMASAPVEKAKLLANLVLDKIQEPELCYGDFEEIKDEIRLKISEKKEHKLSTEQELDRRLERLKGNILPMTEIPLTLNDLGQMNLDTLYSYYKIHYVQPKNMICIATGDFDVDSLKTYLVGRFNLLENKGNVNNSTFEEFDFSKSEENLYIKKKGNNGRLNFNIVYYGAYENSLRNQLILKLMRDVLRSRLLLELRENTGLVYSPYIDLEFKAYPSSAFFFNINGETSNINIHNIERVVEGIIQKLKNEAIGIGELEKMKHSFLVAKKDYLDDRNSAHWRDYLLDSFRTAISIDEIASYEKILASLTVEDIQKAFNQIVKNTQKVNLYLGDFSIDKTK